VNDDELLTLAEQTLTEIKVSDGLSERHASVLAALRIRLKGSAAKTLEDMLDAADDSASDDLADRLAQAERAPKRSLDDLLQEEPKKPEWPS
jgi:hypothetical protein